MSNRPSCISCVSLNVCAHAHIVKKALTHFPYKDSGIDDEYTMRYTYNDVAPELGLLLGAHCDFFVTNKEKRP